MAVYASIKDTIRWQQWQVLSQVIQEYKQVVVLGDFKDILKSQQKDGGYVRSTAFYGGFQLICTF